MSDAITDDTFAHLDLELRREIAGAANSVILTSGILESYAELGYVGGMELALKQIVANTKAAIAHFNQLNELHQRREAANQNRSAA